MQGCFFERLGSCQLDSPSFNVFSYSNGRRTVKDDRSFVLTNIRSSIDPEGNDLESALYNFVEATRGSRFAITCTKSCSEDSTNMEPWWRNHQIHAQCQWIVSWTFVNFISAQENEPHVPQPCIVRNTAQSTSTLCVVVRMSVLTILFALGTTSDDWHKEFN